MLVLSRKPREEIQIGASITVTVLATSGNKVKLGISCPAEVTILRGELSRDPVAAGRMVEARMRPKATPLGRDPIAGRSNGACDPTPNQTFR